MFDCQPDAADKKPKHIHARVEQEPAVCSLYRTSRPKGHSANDESDDLNTKGDADNGKTENQTSKEIA